MSKRKAKKMCKKAMREIRLTHIETVKRLYIVAPKPGFVCMRWYGFTVTASNNPLLDRLIDEQNYNTYKEYDDSFVKAHGFHPWENKYA